MPFVDEHGAPLVRVALEQVLTAPSAPDGGLFVLTRGFVYVDDATGQRVVVTATETPGDLASVPPFLWGLIAPFGRQTAAALLHDHLRREAASVSPARRAAAGRRADRLFRSALLDSGVSVPRAWLMWAGVSLTRDESFAPTSSRLRVVHAIMIALILWLAAFRLLRGTAGPADAVRSVAAVASSALQGDRARPALLVAAVVAPLAPFLLASWLSSRAFAAIETAQWFLFDRRGPRPDGRPTLSGR